MAELTRLHVKLAHAEGLLSTEEAARILEEWDESLHPRVGSGDPEGGQFTSGGGGGGGGEGKKKRTVEQHRNSKFHSINENGKPIGHISYDVKGNPAGKPWAVQLGTDAPSFHATLSEAKSAALSKKGPDSMTHLSYDARPFSERADGRTHIDLGALRDKNGKLVGNMNEQADGFRVVGEGIPTKKFKTFEKAKAHAEKIGLTLHPRKNA